MFNFYLQSFRSFNYLQFKMDELELELDAEVRGGGRGLVEQNASERGGVEGCFTFKSWLIEAFDSSFWQYQMHMHTIHQNR